jgi:hypothetical protein
VTGQRGVRLAGHSGQQPAHPWDSRLEIVIAVALGLAAIVTAASVYLNEHQEHDATRDFHHATHQLVYGAAAGISTPQGRALELSSQADIQHAEDHQNRAADYTLAEVILATSLFLFGVAGVSAARRIKVGALISASIVFTVALVILATV